ncbi:MAG: NAD-binding protein [Myxococcota bacterium]
MRPSLWIGSIAVVLAVGLACMPREYPELGFWESLYATLRLFVFEHDLPHFPKSWPLIAIHFIAPAIALSAAWTMLQRLFNLTPALRTRFASEHVLVCGVGRTGRLLVSTLNKKRVGVVGVDLGPPTAYADFIARERIPLVFGNFQSRTVLERAGASRARTLIFSSGDDLANLEGAIAAYGWLKSERGRPRLIWAHISDEKLAATARLAVRTQGSVAIRFFDTYHIAASRVVARFFDHRVRRGINTVTIIGFGNFGHDLFEVLARDLRDDEVFTIRVIDQRNRHAAVMQLAGELRITERVSFTHADIHDLDLVDAPDKAFFLCTDDDLGNLAGALMLAGKMDATHIYVRMGNWPLPAIAEHLGAERGVTFININQLMMQGIADLPGIFAPAGTDDLEHGKRGTFA